MKYYLYSGLESKEFKSLLTIARTIGTLAIIGFYITLMVAAFSYFNFSASSANVAETASSVANGILIEGFLICGLSFVASVAIAWFIAGQKNETNEFVGQTL